MASIEGRGPKRLRGFEKIEQFKQRFRRLSTRELEERLNKGYLIKEAAVALRELLDQRRRRDSSKG